MADAAPRLPTGLLLCYGLPALPLAMLGLPMFVHLPTVYAQDFGVGLAAVGGVLLAARLLDVVTDPLVGALSDRSAGRLGRRRPWLVLGTPLLVLSVFFLFRPDPDGVGAAHLLLWAALTYLAWTMLQVPYTSWGAELSPAYHERSRVTAWREAFVVAGTLAGAALPAMLAALRGPDGGSGPAVLETMAWIVLILAPPSLALLLWRVPDPPSPRGRAVPWREGVAVLVGNAPFRRLLVAYLLNGVANGLPATLFLLFVTHRVEATAWAGPLLLAYFLSGILGVPLWLRLSYRLGKHRTWCASMAWASAVFVWAPLIGPGEVAAYAALCVLSGLSLGADLFLPYSMQADVVDADRAALGDAAARTGLYFGLWGMATKLALAFAVGIAFPLLELAGFDPGARAEGGGGLWALALLYGFAPVVFKLAAMALVWSFPTGMRQGAAPAE